jgi:hypothetical protein
MAMSPFESYLQPKAKVLDALVLEEVAKILPV